MALLGKQIADSGVLSACEHSHRRRVTRTFPASWCALHASRLTSQSFVSIRSWIYSSYLISGDGMVDAALAPADEGNFAIMCAHDRRASTAAPAVT